MRTYKVLIVNIKINKDLQIKKDAIESIRVELQNLRTYADGGRAGYAER